MSSRTAMRVAGLAATLLAVLASGGAAGERDDTLVPIPLRLPRPGLGLLRPFHIPDTEHLEKPSRKPRPPFLAPKGALNVARGKPVTSSDDEPLAGDLAQVTDGDKRGAKGGTVVLRPGRQWVQVDLGSAHRIYAIVVWHVISGRVYRDVVVQVADDRDGIHNTRTLLNNDYDNSAGLGVGSDKEYVETYEGRLIDAKRVTARYVRLYSNGHQTGDTNDYLEVEVYGRPAK